MFKISELSDEELRSIPRFGTEVTAADVRQARWEERSSSATRRSPLLSAIINGRPVIACLFPIAIGSPKDTTRYEVGWLASEEKARDYVNVR